MGTQSDHEEARSGFGIFWRQLLAALLASRGMAGYNHIATWNAAGNLQLQQDVGGLGVTAGQRAWIVSVIFIGVGFGCLIGAQLTNRFGPRKIISLTIVPYALGTIIIFFATSFHMLLMGRILTSIVAGIPVANCMMYVSGTSSPRYRGAFSLLVDVVVNAEAIGLILVGDYVTWNWLAAICAGAVLLPSVPLLLFLPSDPVWLLQKGKVMEAQRSSRYFGLAVPDKLTDSPIEEPDRNCLKSFKPFRKRKNLQPLAIVIITFLFSAFCGNVSILMHSQVFFREAGIEMDASVCAALFCACRVFATILSVFLVDRFGRRVLMLTSSGGMAVCYAVLVAYYQVSALQRFPILPIVLLMATSCIYAVGIGCIPWCLQGEMFPREMRQFGAGLVPAVYCFFLYASIFTFPLILDVAGESGLYLFYTCVLVAFFGFEFIFVPETKGLTLFQIESLFVKEGQRETFPADGDSISSRRRQQQMETAFDVSLDEPLEAEGKFQPITSKAGELLDVPKPTSIVTPEEQYGSP